MLKLEVYNMIGELIKTETNNIKTVNVQRLSEGAYFVKVYTENYSKTFRFLKGD